MATQEEPARMTSWFETTARENFERAFLPASNQPNLQYLQLGVFEGDASVWLMQNVLTHPTSVLYDVDSWDGGMKPETHGVDSWEKVESFYDTQTQRWRQRDDVNSSGLLVKVKMNVWDWLCACQNRSSASAWRANNPKSGFHFIYIDAGHTVIDTIEAAVLSYRLLRPGGILAFDDYVWESRGGLLDEPQMAIDFFKYMYADRMMVLRVDSQCWLKRVDAQDRP